MIQPYDTADDVSLAFTCLERILINNPRFHIDHWTFDRLLQLYTAHRNYETDHKGFIEQSIVFGSAYIRKSQKVDYRDTGAEFSFDTAFNALLLWGHYCIESPFTNLLPGAMHRDYTKNSPKGISTNRKIREFELLYLTPPPTHVYIPQNDELRKRITNCLKTIDIYPYFRDASYIRILLTHLERFPIQQYNLVEFIVKIAEQYLNKYTREYWYVTEHTVFTDIRNKIKAIPVETRSV